MDSSTKTAQTMSHFEQSMIHEKKVILYSLFDNFEAQSARF